MAVSNVRFDGTKLYYRDTKQTNDRVKVKMVGSNVYLYMDGNPCAFVISKNTSEDVVERLVATHCDSWGMSLSMDERKAVTAYIFNHMPSKDTASLDMFFDNVKIHFNDDRKVNDRIDVKISYLTAFLYVDGMNVCTFYPQACGGNIELIKSIISEYCNDYGVEVSDDELTYAARYAARSMPRKGRQ